MCPCLFDKKISKFKENFPKVGLSLGKLTLLPDTIFTRQHHLKHAFPMAPEEIKKTWNNLLSPFIVGLIAFIASVLIYLFGSPNFNYQLLGFFGSIFGLIFMGFPGVKMLQFRRYLKQLNDEQEDNS